jgi:two-component system cell cycle response regulator DivK
MAKEPILIIDDNPSNVKLARLLLANAGYEVRTAADSTEALETLRSFRPRLILMDIQLPGMDGLKLTRRLKEDPLTRDSIIVAVTAYAMRGDEERAKEAGCDGYMSKPIDTRTFVDQIRRYLQASPEKTPAARPESGDPNDLLRELRNVFVTEGAESSQRYAQANLSDSEIEAMQRVAHHWVGMGGTLGFPEITTRARELEEMLRSLPLQWQKRVAAGFAEMWNLFVRCMETAGEPPVPVDLVQSLASKRVGLIGFTDHEAVRVRAAFDQVHAVARDLGALSEGLGMEALHTHDLIVLNACTEEGIHAWESVLAQPLLAKPMLLVSSRTVLMDSKLALVDRAVDFVLEPWDSEELLCRAQRVIGQKPRPPQPQIERNRRPLVIIADDDPMIHLLLTPMLEKLGVDCRSVGDGREALDAVRKLSPDVLVLDIGMPNIGGMAVLREIRRVQQNHAVQILMFSVRQQKSDISMALAFGANDYAVKPFDPEDVVMRIMRLLPSPSDTHYRGTLDLHPREKLA